MTREPRRLIQATFESFPSTSPFPFPVEVVQKIHVRIIVDRAPGRIVVLIRHVTGIIVHVVSLAIAVDGFDRLQSISSGEGR